LSPKRPLKEKILNQLNKDRAILKIRKVEVKVMKAERVEMMIRMRRMKMMKKRSKNKLRAIRQNNLANQRIIDLLLLTAKKMKMTMRRTLTARMVINPIIRPNLQVNYKMIDNLY